MTNFFKIIAIFILLSASNFTYAQLSFCQGSKGDPIFIENFGSGAGFGPQLASGVTSYTYVSSVPNDGEYTIYNRTNLSTSWHESPDHTPDNAPDGIDGKSLIVNAGFNPGEFYKRTVTGLCINTTFEFTAWVMNIYNPTSNACAGTGIPNDIAFEIWDSTETTLLKSGSTGPIEGTSSPIWKQYGLVFTTGTQTSVVLKMRNNGAGGCGNDLAIDDIMFRSCGDFASIKYTGITGDSYKICQYDAPVNITLTVEITATTPHFYQWQESIDNTTWTNIAGENGITYSTPGLTTSRYYRVIVAQDATNLSNTFCSTLSDHFSIIITPQPVAPASNGDQSACSNETFPVLQATPGTNETINWYDASSGGTLLLANSSTYTPTTGGTYYAEAQSLTIPPCTSTTRTLVKLTVNNPPLVGNDEEVPLCVGDSIDLDAGTFPNVKYDWSTLVNTQKITVTTGNIYTVKVTDTISGCSATKTFNVKEVPVPIITNVITNDKEVTIVTSVPGNYEYSLDGINFQSSNIFENVTGGQKTAYVRNKDYCTDQKDELDFTLIVIPKFFSPNGDNYNDYFYLEGFQSLGTTSVSVFDRYGKLITYLNKANPTWDGTLNKYPLPADDYWYKITLENGKEIKGHFSLIR